MTLLGLILGSFTVFAGATTALFFAATLSGWSRFTGAERGAGICLTCFCGLLTGALVTLPLFFF